MKYPLDCSAMFKKFEAEVGRNVHPKAAPVIAMFVSLINEAYEEGKLDGVKEAMA